MDGIQEFSVPSYYLGDHGSALRSAQEAPAGGYQSEWMLYAPNTGKTTSETRHDNNRDYYFRVRTVVDETGNVKSALYGKIYEDDAHFSYYLNPTPNSRNVEFDRNHNLFSGNDTFPP